MRNAASSLFSTFQFTLSFGHTAYLVFLAFEDPGFHNGAAFSGLATSTNIDQMRYRSYALIAIDVGTLLIDAGTALANKYRMRRYVRAKNHTFLVPSPTPGTGHAHADPIIWSWTPGAAGQTICGCSRHPDGPLGYCGTGGGMGWTTCHIIHTEIT